MNIWQGEGVDIGKAELVEFIARYKLAVVSTVGLDCAPQAALVGIAVTPELEIVFDTVRSSRKYANLMANPAAAFVVGCVGDETLQYEGVAKEVAGKELELYKAAYFTAWPDGRSREGWPDICYFVVKPKWIRFSDYGVTPAAIEEFGF